VGPRAPRTRHGRDLCHLWRAVGVVKRRARARPPGYIYATAPAADFFRIHHRSSQQRRPHRSTTIAAELTTTPTGTDGERPGTVLRQGRPEQGLLDARGGHAAHRLHSEVRPRQLARATQASRYVLRRQRSRSSSHSHAVYMQVLTVTSSICRFAAVREELPAAVDQLPPAGPQARQLHRRGGGHHHKAARHARQQVRTGRRASSVPTSKNSVDRF
jgi:hypothetical protein